MRARTAAVAAALTGLAVAGCGSSPHHQAAAAPTRTTVPAASASPTRPAGCDQVLVVVGTVRGELENAPTDATLNQAYHQLAALGKSIPLGMLRINVDRANFDMTQYWEQSSSGPATKLAAATAADLQRLDRECGGAS